MTARTIVRGVLVGGALLAGVSTSAHAQATWRRPALELLAAAGNVSPHAAPGLVRNDGVFAFVGLEARPLGSRFGVRLEGRVARQDLQLPEGGGVSGNVETPGLALAARYDFLHTRGTQAVTPYVLAGVSLARPSTRISVASTDPHVPDASYEQTSSEVAGGLLGGVGARVRVARIAAFAELRYEGLRTRRLATTTSPLVAGVALPLSR